MLRFITKKQRLKQIKLDMYYTVKDLISFFSRSGYNLDYSMQGISVIESFINNEAIARDAVEKGQLFNTSGDRIYSMGVYLGETLIKLYGGKWIINHRGNNMEVTAMVKLDSGAKLWPIRKVIDRCNKGECDNLIFYCESFE